MSDSEAPDHDVRRRYWIDEEWYWEGRWHRDTVSSLPRGDKRWINEELTDRMRNKKPYWDRWIVDAVSGEIDV